VKKRDHCIAWKRLALGSEIDFTGADFEKESEMNA